MLFHILLRRHVIQRRMGPSYFPKAFLMIAALTTRLYAVTVSRILDREIGSEKVSQPKSQPLEAHKNPNVSPLYYVK